MPWWGWILIAACLYLLFFSLAASSGQADDEADAIEQAIREKLDGETSQEKTNQTPKP